VRPTIYPPVLYLRTVVDLLGIFFLTRFTERPLRFFGLFGLLLALPGAVILGVLLLQRLEGVGIANRPALLLGTLLLALGVQAIALGLVAEIIVHLSAPTRRGYRLAPGSDK
jgi:dolichol-phosphate mannosyltransferase